MYGEKMNSIIVQFVVLVIGMASIGSVLFGTLGAILGFIIGLYLFWKLRRRNKVDYHRIEKMFDDRLGRPRK